MKKLLILEKLIAETQEELKRKSHMPFASIKIKARLENLWIKHNQLSKII